MSSPVLRTASLLLLTLLLGGILSGCGDEPPQLADSATARPAARPTRAPAPTARPAAQPTEAPSSERADWTILVYLAGDNDLEPFAVADYMEMASVGSSDELNIIVQLDRIRSDEEWDDTSHNNWGTTKRFRVEKGKKPTTANQLSALGELNMGDPAVLEDFISWGVTSYPAERTALIFWNHGAAWPGVASDDTSDGDMITLPELTATLAAVQQRASFGTFDLIGFDACLMAQLDVLRSIKPFGKVAIGSADLEPGDGWAWNAWLADLRKDSSQSAAEIAPDIIKSFMAFYKEQDEPTVTLSAFDLTKLDQLIERVDQLAGAMLEDMPSAYKAIAQARSAVLEYAPDQGDEVSAVDLGHLAKLLTKQRGSRDVADAASELLDVLDAARVAQGNGSAYRRNASGMSVYFPRKAKYYADDYGEGSPLAELTRWDEFLKSFYQGGRGKTTRSAITKPVLSSPTASIDQATTIQASVAGADTAEVSYFIGAVDSEDPDTLLILKEDYIYPPGTTPSGEITPWSEDATEVSLTWNATSWYISNGQDIVEVGLSPLRYGSSIYSVAGTYTSKKTGRTKQASLNFEVIQGQGRLLHVWGYDGSANLQLQPAEMKPAPGDSFTPEVFTLTATDSDEPEEGLAEGEPISFGEQPLLAFEGPAINGEYVIGLLVENIDGEFSEEYSDVTVDNGDASDNLSIPDLLPAPSAGAQAGTLAYRDERLGFRLEYPEEWQPFALGDDQVAFASPDETSEAYFGVDVYSSDPADGDGMGALLEELLEELKAEQNFKQLGEITEVAVGERAGPGAEYSYQDDEGTRVQGRAVVVANVDTGTLYLLTFEAPQQEYAATSDTLEQMLGSFISAN